MLARKHTPVSRAPRDLGIFGERQQEYLQLLQFDGS